MTAAGCEAEEWPDKLLLEALDMRDHRKLSYGTIAVLLNRSKNSVVGALKGTDRITDRFDPDGNQNGTMPRGWWR